MSVRLSFTSLPSSADEVGPKALPAGMPGMTMSAGVSSTAGGDAPNDPSVLIARADEALYRAKNLGRNRVEAV
jgi:PleD family two-component response regulator